MMLDCIALKSDPSLEEAAENSSCQMESTLPRISCSQPNSTREGRVVQKVPKRWQDLHACVALLLESNTGSPFPIEKRVHRRYPFRKPLAVTPVSNSSGRPDTAKSFPAFGIDMSTTGVCFVARQLVPARRAVLSCEAKDNQTVSFLFEPRWVRFTRGGWYQTGGRLLEILEEPIDPPPTIRLLDPLPDIDELCEKSRHS